MSINIIKKLKSLFQRSFLAIKQSNPEFFIELVKNGNNRKIKNFFIKYVCDATNELMVILDVKRNIGVKVCSLNEYEKINFLSIIFDNHILSSYDIWILKNKDTIIAMGIVNPKSEPSNLLYLMVAKDLRRKKFGSQLLIEIVKYYGNIYAKVEPSKPELKNFYEKIGFVYTGIENWNGIKYLRFDYKK